MTGRKKKTAALIVAVLLGTGFAATLLLSSMPVDAEKITVYKSPSCGCCKKWVRHLEENGFTVKVHNRHDLEPIKKSLGVDPRYQSCHTAVIDNYVIEGHVPAADIQRLLAEKPHIKGLMVPGMPMGSPGMEGPRKDRYSVLAVDKQDGSTVFSRH